MSARGEVGRKGEPYRAMFQWTLQEFSSLGSRVESYCISPEFSFGYRKWCLLLYPNGRKDNQCTVMLYLRLSDAGPALRARHSVGIQTEKGVTQSTPFSTHLFPQNGNRQVTTMYAQNNTNCFQNDVLFTIIKSWELLRRRDELLPRDTLTLDLTLERHVVCGSPGTAPYTSFQAWRNVTDASVQATGEESESCGGKGIDKIVEDVGKLWPNGDYTDVILKVRDVEFKAHRTILAARTPVLGAMFEHDTVEKASGVASIEDCDPEVFEQLLHYVYRGAPRELTAENASALYVLADKYLVNEVKALCVRCMRETLSFDSFCDTIRLSLMHSEEELLNTATDFFSRNMIDVLKTVEWQRFLLEHPTWANEMLILASQLTAARSEKEK